MRRAALALAVLVLGACDAPGGAPPQVGGPVPEYSATALEGGRPASLASLRGGPVLLNVWATWCHPCREEMPDLQRLHTELAPRGLTVLGVSIDEPGQEDAIREFLRDHGVTYPVWLDPDDRAAAAFGLVGVPGTFLIDARGTLLWRHMGPLRSDDPGLRRALEPVLRPS